MIRFVIAVAIAFVARTNYAVEEGERVQDLGKFTVPAVGESDGGLHVIPKDGPIELIEKFVNQNREPRHAAAILIVGKGTKREKLIEELSNDEVLKALLIFGVRYGKGESSLTVHRHSYDPVVYNGKWTKKELHAWLSDVSYPPVNRLGTTFAIAKYMLKNPFGVLIIGYPEKDPSMEILRELESQAEKFSSQIKFAFLTRNHMTEKYCDEIGLRSNDELLLLTNPKLPPRSGDVSFPGAPKYRLANLTRENIRVFFERYSAGTLERYYRPNGPYNGPVLKHGIRELSAWDFQQVVHDPTKSVLVAYTAKGCGPCKEYEAIYSELATKVRNKQQSKAGGMFANLVIARIDQSSNEHGEDVRGVPHVRYYGRGDEKPKKHKVIQKIGLEETWAFLEEHLEMESHMEQSEGGKKLNQEL